MEGNILSGGVDELNTVKESLLKLNVYKENNDVLVTEETKLEKNIQSKEKAISDEIISTTKKRKDEIDAAYNEQIDKTRTRIKKIRSKKEKSKNQKVSERIELETADLREEHRQLLAESKSIFKQNQVPSFCNTKLYYALFLPKGMGDIIIICLTLLLTLLAIPSGIYFLLLPDKEMIYLVLIYFITVVFFGGTYMLIDNNTKDKHRDSINRVRVIRNNIVNNKKKRNQIRKRILKDRDESPYGLEKFNQELQELDNEINSITEQKKDALAIFENTTRFVIGEEIKVRNQEELTVLKKEYDRVYAEIKKMEENIKLLSMGIASNYEAYLGKEFMSVEKLDLLADLMTSNNLTTISEAVAFYKQEDN